MSEISPLAGTLARPDELVDVAALVAAYYNVRPDPSIALQRVSFGTSGHRGTSLDGSFNEAHVLAITQAICMFRQARAITGPLFIGIDTHALSVPAYRSAIEVLAGNGVTTLAAEEGEFTPTPAVSHAILTYNRERKDAFADGIVVTPSHNPPESGGFKYNPPNGGPADEQTTKWIETSANALLTAGTADVRRIPFDRAAHGPALRRHDFVSAYVNDLESVIDFSIIRASRLCIGVDPLGGAGVHYWNRVGERYGIDLTVTNEAVDPTFAFMPRDWDGRIRMDPSSPFAMRRLTTIANAFDIGFACDTDHDRHGIVTPSGGLMAANDYLAVAIDYLCGHRSAWRADTAIGKTIVSSAMIDRVVAKAGRRLHETPVGFKWFVDGLAAATLAFAGEESAGATFLRSDGTPWTTDKDGIAPALLAAEMTARDERDPALRYRALVDDLGAVFYRRVDAPANAPERRKLASVSAQQMEIDTLAGEPVVEAVDRAPANDAPIGGIKLIAEHGWFAARPSGTENIYKIYAESFRDAEHLGAIIEDAQRIVGRILD